MPPFILEFDFADFQTRPKNPKSVNSDALPNTRHDSGSVNKSKFKNELDGYDPQQATHARFMFNKD